MSVTTEQRDALLAFAASVGPQWKRALIQLWKTGGAPAQLQALEQSHGPIWLEALDLGIISPDGAGRPRRPPTPLQVKVLRVLASLAPGEALTGPDLGRVDKRDSRGALNVIQAGICDGDQLGTRPDVGR